MLVSADVRDAQTLRLVVTDAGDGITCDQANWANARLIRTSAAHSNPDAPRIDMGKFARVVTWDPNSQQGPRWSRAKEFPAEDLFLETDVLPDTDGCYVVPVANDGRGCLGLQWLERRRIRQLIIGFADGGVGSSTRMRSRSSTGRKIGAGIRGRRSGKASGRTCAQPFAAREMNTLLSRRGKETRQEAECGRSAVCSTVAAAHSDPTA